MNNKRIAIYPGTFDPITLGHLDIIKRASVLFDKLVIAVACNSSLKTSLFSVRTRINIINDELKQYKIENVVVKSFNGLLIEFLHNEGAKIIIRGLRAISDLKCELQMSYINKTLDCNIETIFLPATESIHFISSTLVKEVVKLGGDTKKLISANVKKVLLSKMNKCIK